MPTVFAHQRMGQPALGWNGHRDNLPSLILTLQADPAICIPRCTIT
jgi:hypothetical protein